MSKFKTKKARRAFMAEFKAQAVDLVRSSGKSIGKVAKDFDLGESALREWVTRAQEPESDGKLVDDDERAEMKRLREGVRELDERPVSSRRSDPLADL